MSSIIRSIVVVAALLGSASAAFAGSYGHGYGYGHGWGYGKGKHDARVFFDQLRKNSN
jgi:hypothetical protein